MRPYEKAASVYSINSNVSHNPVRKSVEEEISNSSTPLLQLSQNQSWKTIHHLINRHFPEESKRNSKITQSRSPTAVLQTSNQLSKNIKNKCYPNQVN